MSDPSARVRQATVEDREAIWTFLAKAYGDLSIYKLPDRWQWLFQENPFLDDRGLPIWLAEVGDRIVGQMAAMPVELRFDGETHPAAWAIDLVVLPECRGQGVGNRLHEATVAHSGILMKLTMAPSTRRMAERAGALNLGPLPMYFRPARTTAEAVRRYVRLRTERRPPLRRVAEIGMRYAYVHGLASGTLNLASGLRNLGRSSGTGPSEVVERTEFDAEFEEIEERTRSDFGVSVPRSLDFLRWRFRSFGGLAYRKFVARRDGQTRGYVILRHPDPVERQAGIVVDLVCPTDDSQTIRDLLDFAVRFFGKDVAGIVCSLPEEAFGAGLREAGFLRVGTQHPTCVCTDPEIRARLEKRNSDWYLSRADHDWDQVLP